MRLVHYLRVNFCSDKSQRRRQRRREAGEGGGEKGRILGITFSWAGNFHENRVWVNSKKLD